jgi:hypothetical protein
MTVPGQSFIIVDGGIGNSSPASNAYVVMGTSSIGTVNTLQAISAPDKVAGVFGQGPLAEALAHLLAEAGGPQYGMRITGSVPGASGAVTPTGGGPVVTVTGAVAFDTYTVILEVLKGGILGVGQFRYTLDGGKTYSGRVTIPGGGVYAIPNTNVSVTFAAGTYLVPSTYAFNTTAPYYGSSDLAAAWTALRLLPTQWRNGLLVGQPATAAGSTTIFNALETEVNTAANMFQWHRFGLDYGGIDTAANVETAALGVEAERLYAVYGQSRISSAKPIVGYGNPFVSNAVIVAARAAKGLLSTDPGRVLSGALNCTENSFDSNFSSILDDQKIGTLRSFPNRGGVFICNAWLKSGPSSDFRYLQHGSILDVACEVAYREQLNFIGKIFRTVAGGTIDPRDKRSAEAQVLSSLDGALIQPTNEEGTEGHVSAIKYEIDDTVNLLTTQLLKATVGIRPHGYPKFIETTIGFTLQAA